MKKNLLILLCIIIGINKIHSQTNWELLNPKPTANTGKGVEFVTDNIGYIITVNELLETVDAGNTWTKKQNISSGNDMSFSNTTGYIVGNYGYVLKSLDNGASWNQISTGFNGDYNTVTIIDANNIILSTSNSVVKTNDAGSTWQSFTIPNVSVVKTAFTSSLIGHAVSNNGIILKTIDGGQNWYKTKDNSNTTPSGYFTVYFVNQNIGFATREHDYMYKTTDAGETWVEISGTSQAINDFHFLDENNGFATGEYGATYKTTNGGNTWSQIFFQNGLIYGTSMYGIYFRDNNIGYATGTRGRIIKTTDGGTTWTPNSITDNDFRQLQFIDGNIGYAQSGSNFYKTINGGNTWGLVGSISLGISVFSSDFTFVNENLGYATTGGTYGGHVFKTTDGGITWTVLNNGSVIIEEGITSIFFLNKDTGFISGGFNQRKVMKTTDGGANWTQVQSISFGQIQFITNQIGFASRTGYSNGRIYKTIDGGNTWNVSIEVDKGISAFDFIDENNGYFVGDQGLLYKTIDGGINWIKLEVPYGYYTKVKFYSKNIGYIVDKDGKLYKTENGGLNWKYLTQQYAINSIEIVGNKIYTAGTYGKIYKSEVEYKNIVLNIYPAENKTNSSAKLTGNVTSNGELISDIQIQYSSNSGSSNTVSIVPSVVGSNESLSFSLDLLNLKPNTTYYYRLTGKQNSNINSSESLSFKTLSDYEIITNYSYNYSSDTAEVSGTIVSNGYDITNVEFQYGTSSNALNNILSGSPTTIEGHTAKNVIGSLKNLKPQTQYFYRIKATHQGNEIYGEILSFTTLPEYNIHLYNPNINGSDVLLSAYLTSYGQDITDIMFEYGTIDYENKIATNLSQVASYDSNYVTATISNLDTNAYYYYRLKAMHNGKAIYSKEGVFNFSRNILLVRGQIEENKTNTLILNGLINSYGNFLTNVQFEYGITDSFGSSIAGTPNYAYGSSTNLITSTINDPLPNQTYYYRLVATNNGLKIYSDTYQYTTGTLSLTNFGLKQEIAVYPNPATDFVYIKSNVSENVKSIELYNSLGQRIYYQNAFKNSDLKVNVSNFTKGLYLIKVTFESTKEISSKLILN